MGEVIRGALREEERAPEPVRVQPPRHRLAPVIYQPLAWVQEGRGKSEGAGGGGVSLSERQVARKRQRATTGVTREEAEQLAV
eukprot:5046091-Prymnesium_polylepis.2